MAGTGTTVLRTAVGPGFPADKYGHGDSEATDLIALDATGAKDLTRRLGLDDELGPIAHELAAGGWDRTTTELLRRRPEIIGDLRRLYVNTFARAEAVLHIPDVTLRGPLFDDQPFTLAIRYQNPGDAPVVLASVQVAWAGEPFVVEREVEAFAEAGEIEVHFGEGQTLPVGPARFHVELFAADGRRAAFERSVYGIPANPLALGLGPAGAHVTGSWSARGDYLPASDTFLTECEITISNGDATSVGMNRRVSWEFWDGTVGGGTRIESGAFDWSSPITVPAQGVWRGTVWFSSPRGSGIFSTYDRKEDLAINISMRANDGRVIQGQITARVMLAFGVNIIKVGAFGAQEHVDLYDAVDEMRRIYERRDITLRGVDRRLIDNAQAGSYPIINSEDEFRDLLEDWSCRNDFVDVYVVQDFQWSTYNGHAGDIPGPAAKGGRKDGVAVEKTGYTDAAGTARLRVTTLAQLIGHEVGHYLGLQHQETTDNLMRQNTGDRGPALDYTQYRTTFPHGYMVYE